MSYEVKFNSDKSKGGNGHEITDWKWDFGDGEISNEQNPKHFYNEIGQYNVSLTVENDGGESDTSTQCIEVPGGDNMEHIVNVSIVNCEDETIEVPDGCAQKRYKFVGAISGNPYAGTTVELLSADENSVLQTTTTDAEGYATFTDAIYNNCKLKIVY